MNRRELLTGAAGLATGAALPHPHLQALAGSVPSPARLALDPCRPQYHLLPAANWMNDPNGPIYWRGNYHLFYQYNPEGAYWGDMHWGHAVSPDMIHWQHRPVALAPTADGPDAAGCFTGTAIVDQDQVAAIYTGVVRDTTHRATLDDGVHRFRESQCLALALDDELVRWRKLARPVIASPPARLQVTGFRDPAPWRHADAWYLAVGSGTRLRGGAVLLYRSQDLREWTYLHPLAEGEPTGSDAVNPVAAGDMWECPDFFPLDGRYVLLYGTEGAVHWQTGLLDEKTLRFHPQRTGILDQGAFYAAKTQLDAHGNRIVWGWIPEQRPLEQYRAAGWAGMMSLPRRLSLDSEGRLRVQVSPAVRILRGHARQLRAGSGTSGQLSSLAIADATGELQGSFHRGDTPFTVRVLGTLPNGQRLPAIVALHFDPAAPHQITIDNTVIALPVSDQPSLDIDIYLDGSVAEIFLQRSAAYTTRFYYPGGAAPRVQLQLQGSASTLQHLSAWQLRPISPDRLTR